MNKYSYRCRLNHTIQWTFRWILKDRFTLCSNKHMYCTLYKSLLLMRSLHREVSMSGMGDKTSEVQPKSIKLNHEILTGSFKDKNEWKPSARSAWEAFHRTLWCTPPWIVLAKQNFSQAASQYSFHIRFSEGTSCPTENKFLSCLGPSSAQKPQNWRITSFNTSTSWTLQSSRG